MINNEKNSFQSLITTQTNISENLLIIEICYMDTDTFIMHIKTEDFYKDIANDVERWFDTSNNDENDKRPLSSDKNKKVLGMFKDELEIKINTEVCAHRAKVYALRTDENIEPKRPKGTKNFVVKKDITFENYRQALFNSISIITSQQRPKSSHHIVYTEEVNKIALNYIDDERLQTFDGITTYPYGTNAFKVCESEMLVRKKAITIKLYCNKI